MWCVNFKIKDYNDDAPNFLEFISNDDDYNNNNNNNNTTLTLLH